MQNYVIITDSGSDLPEEMLKRLGIPSISLNCFMKDDPTAAVTLRGKAFYDELRAGKVACTSAANLSVFRETFSAFLKEGTDILYLSFSSALSCMCATAKLAADELSEEFPERKIHVIDSRCASLGQGLLVYFIAEKKAHGATLDELAAYAEEMKYCMMHWFTVDDLLFLKRGGRLSTVSALAGTLLGIKPVLTVSPDGKLTAAEKQRGRRNAILSLVKHYDTECTDFSAPVYIGHADALDAAEQLKEQLVKEHGVKQVMIEELGPVIGAHTGPGLLALFYIGKSLV